MNRKLFTYISIREKVEIFIIIYYCRVVEKILDMSDEIDKYSLESSQFSDSSGNDSEPSPDWDVRKTMINLISIQRNKNTRRQ